MINHTEAIEHYYAIRKAKFGFVEHVELMQSVDPKCWTGFNLTIDLRAEADMLSSRLQLLFTGVQECRIGRLDGLLRYMIEVAWIGDSQMEGKRFKISESEYDAFSFVCQSFTTVLE